MASDNTPVDGSSGIHVQPSSPDPERSEMGEEHGDAAAEAAARAVLLDVKVLKSWNFGCDGVQVFQCYGHTQRQPGHSGGDGGRVNSERVPSWDDTTQRVGFFYTV